MKLKVYDCDHPSYGLKTKMSYDSVPRKTDLVTQMINVLTDEIYWFNEKWLSKNTDVEDVLYRLAENLLHNGEAMIYTYIFYLK